MRLAPRILAFLLPIAAAIPSHAAAAELPQVGIGNLAGLFLPHEGKVVQYSSHAREADRIDAWDVGPGKTVTLVDHHGAGIVRRWWMTVLQREQTPLLWRHMILRCYWDGETDPSVEAPLSDFFGLGFGEWHEYVSLPVSATSGGLNCKWPMPFHKSARITLENRAPAAVGNLWFNIEIETLNDVPARSLYFHAQFRRIAPAKRGEPVTVLETVGSGQYVGTVLSARTLKGAGLSFLEGDEEVYVDGEREPSIVGTGTEDYFGGGLYAVTGTSDSPDHGITVIDTGKNRFSGYRWHIDDPIPFKKSLRFLLEHGQTRNESVADYATLAVWYQTHPHPKFPPLPAELGLIEPSTAFQIPEMIEAEGSAAGAVASGGSVQTQSMGEYDGNWSGDAQLLWRGAKVGDHLTFMIVAPETKEYSLEGYFTRSADYGDVRVLLAGRELGVVRGYNAAGIPSGVIPLGRVHLQEGQNFILLELAGKDARSTGFLVGVDGFRLVP
jgi:hypothetical protein